MSRQLILGCHFLYSHHLNLWTSRDDVKIKVKLKLKKIFCQRESDTNKSLRTVESSNSGHKIKQGFMRVRAQMRAIVWTPINANKILSLWECWRELPRVCKSLRVNEIETFSFCQLSFGPVLAQAYGLVYTGTST